MIDESALASGIYENLSKCLALREKYQQISLQDASSRAEGDEFGVVVVISGN
jgi:hypothetical protein